MLAQSSATSPGVDRLLEGVVRIGGIEPFRAQSLTLAVLGVDTWDRIPATGLSGLNYDNSPLQFVLTTGAGRPGLRLLGDPSSDIADPAGRYYASLRAMDRVLDLAGSKSIGALFRETLERNLPQDPSGLAEYPDGVMWLGAALDGPGCVMYVDARRGGPRVALDRLLAWLRALCGGASAAEELVDSLRRRSQLMCLGVEGLNITNARAKVYWRLDEAAELHSLGIPGFRDRAFSEFLSLAVGQRRIRLSGIVLNAGIHVATGEWADVKIDVCGCRNCLNFSRPEAGAAIDAVTSHFGMTSLPIADILDYGDFAFCGLGVDESGQRRLNVYIKPACVSM